MLKKKLDLPVFCLPDGSVTEHLRQTFKAFLTEAGLLKCLKTGRDLTLYSLRHTYATFALVNGGIDIHALTKQMGTSIGMIERHYSHLTLVLSRFSSGLFRAMFAMKEIKNGNEIHRRVSA